MYRIIFPDDETVPSPCMPALLSPCAIGCINNAPDPKPDIPLLQSTDKYKTFLHAELQRRVRPVIEEYAASLFEEFKKKVGSNTVENLHNVGTKVLETFHFQEEQPSCSTLPVMSPGQVFATAAAAEPSPLPIPTTEMSKEWSSLVEMKDDFLSNDLLANVRFDIDRLLEGDHLALSGPLGGEDFSMEWPLN